MNQLLKLLGKIGLGPEKDRIDEMTRIERTSRDSYRYIEGDRAMEIYAEIVIGKRDRAIDTSSLKAWLPPHHKEIVTPEEQQRIMQKIVKYFEDRGHSCEIL